MGFKIFVFRLVRSPFSESGVDEVRRSMASAVDAEV